MTSNPPDFEWFLRKTQDRLRGRPKTRLELFLENVHYWWNWYVEPFLTNVIVFVMVVCFSLLMLCVLKILSIIISGEP